MRVRIVLAHPVASLAGDRREGEVALALAARGHDAAVFRSHRPNQTPQPGRFEQVARFFPVDVADEEAHEATCAALIEALEADQPEALLLKGIDYRLIRDVAERFHRRARLVAIIGGVITDPVVTPLLDFVFTEFAGQIEEQWRKASRLPPDEVLPKFVDWTAVASAPDAARDLDIVNVGNFFEERKNQEALFPLLRRHACCLIGDGERLPHFKALTRAYRGRIEYPGQIDAAGVFARLKRAKLMVHTSRWEGYPRVIAEALACGTPVVAFKEGVRGGFDPAWGVLTDDGELVGTVERLLADSDRLATMSAAARAHAAAHFTLPAILEKIERVLTAE